MGWIKLNVLNAINIKFMLNIGLEKITAIIDGVSSVSIVVEKQYGAIHILKP